MTFATRQCVVCRAAFFPHVSDQWWCSDEHHETLKTLAAQRNAEFEPESEDGASEAEIARVALSDDADLVPGPNIGDALDGVVAVLKASKKVVDAVDAYSLLLQAQVMLDRVVSVVEKGVTRGHDSGGESD